jgi:large repetitive protein
MRYVRVVLLMAVASAIVAFGPEAQASTTPITQCDQTVKTSAVLTRGLFCQGMPGIVVGASGITIDLKGFRLRGDNTSGDVGVDDLGGFDKVTVKDGVVRNFDTGVYASGDDLVVSDVVVSGNSLSGMVDVGSSAKITSVTASGNGTDGIAVLGSSASITSAAASGNGAIGIEATGDSASIKSSTASGNHNGFLVGHSASLKSVTASGNFAAGIGGVTISGLSIASATASGNGTNGIVVSGPSVSIKSSTAFGNGENGIEVDGDAASLKGNHADANGFPGGASDLAGLGILVAFTTTAPTGTNTAEGNDDRAECDPAFLC